MNGNFIRVSRKTRVCKRCTFRRTIVGTGAGSSYGTCGLMPISFILGQVFASLCSMACIVDIYGASSCF